MERGKGEGGLWLKWGEWVEKYSGDDDDGMSCRRSILSRWILVEEYSHRFSHSCVNLELNKNTIVLLYVLRLIHCISQSIVDTEKT